MEELISLLENFFSKDTRYHTKEEIKKQLKLKGENQEKILESAIKELEENGIIFFDSKKGYRIFPTDCDLVFGQIEINKAGTGFVHTKNGYTILIENIDLNGALNGDNVIASITSNKRKDFYSGEIFKIVKRKNGNLIFEVVGNGSCASLVPYNINENVLVDINSNQLKNLIDGEYVLVSVGCNNEYGTFKGNIEKIIGHKDDPNIELKTIFAKYNIPVEFDEEVLKEASLIPKEVSEEEIKDRVDLRNENIFTIDCDNTKDRDDAVGIKKLDNGNYLLKVNISHVSHYIKEGSKLFNEALTRCFSHYLGNTCNPMFPHTISNGICSLNQDVDRLTRTVEMEINYKGEIVNYNIYKSVINSKLEMSYSKVNDLLNGKSVKGYNKYYSDLSLMADLNYILEEARRNRNYLDFDTSEANILEKNDEIIGVAKNDLGLSGKIIENFMIIANNVVYSNFAWFTLAYRVHETPNEEKVREIIDILRKSGIKIPKIKNVNANTLKSIIENLGTDETAEVARECLLRSMKKAGYSTENLGHFALQLDTYGHFTSPIRRVIDLLTHTIIDNIEEFNVSKESFDHFDSLLKEVCKKANDIEKIGDLMEEEANDMLMAKYMKNHIGEEFEVIVTEIGKNSMLVRTKNLIRGKIKIENMLDDTYYYDRDKQAIIGKKEKKKYQIGTKLFVLVKNASPANRTINFEIPKQKIKKIS